jgi:hypothetical protein
VIIQIFSKVKIIKVKMIGQENSADFESRKSLQTEQVFPTDRNNATDKSFSSVALFLSVGVNFALLTCRF